MKCYLFWDCSGEDSEKARAVIRVEKKGMGGRLWENPRADICETGCRRGKRRGFRDTSLFGGGTCKKGSVSAGGKLFGGSLLGVYRGGAFQRRVMTR